MRAVVPADAACRMNLHGLPCPFQTPAGQYALLPHAPFPGAAAPVQGKRFSDYQAIGLKAVELLHTAA